VFTWFVVLILGVCSSLWILILRAEGHGDLWWATFALAPIAAFQIYRDHEFTKWLRNQRKGAIGEEQVGAVIRKLELVGYRAMHGLDRGNGDIDHVLIGPTGSFVIETKAWRGRVTVGSADQLLRSGHDEQRTIARTALVAREIHGVLARAGINTWVEAVVVLTATSLREGPRKIRAVHVVNIADLARFVVRQNHRLSDIQIEAAFNALEQQYL
jgi:hypothetical protein